MGGLTCKVAAECRMLDFDSRTEGCPIVDAATLDSLVIVEQAVVDQSLFNPNQADTTSTLRFVRHEVHIEQVQ